MAGFRITRFAGLVPRMFRRGLAPNQAQLANNCRLTNGQIEPERKPLFVNAPGVTGLTSIFRMEDDNGGEKWLAWTKDVDVARGPVAGDELQRIYWTGDFEPRMSTLANATAGAAPYPTGSGNVQYVLGVFPPVDAPTVTPAAGSGVTRSYVYTFVTPLGEESAPSPPASATGTTGTWNLSAMDVMPSNTFAVTSATWASGIATYNVSSTFGLRAGEQIVLSGFTPSGYNFNGAIDSVTATQIKVKMPVNPGAIVTSGTAARVSLHNATGAMRRIYRTIVSASGEAEFYFVAEISAGTTTYADAATDATVILNTKLESDDWAMPPTNMHSITVMANAIGVGASGNEFCFSEAGRPHAWPARYRQTAKNCTRIVSLGSFGTTVVAGTDGNPNMVTGVEPLSMGGGADAIDEAWPCLSKRGTVSAEFGVLFPTADGLAVISTSGSQIATRTFYTRREWAKLHPETFRAAIRDNKYCAAYDGDDGGRMLVIDRAEYASVTTHDVDAAAVWTDALTGLMYVVEADSIKEWANETSPRSLFDWMSREWVFPKPVSIGAVKIDADYDQSPEEAAALQASYDATVAANQLLIDGHYVGGAMAEEAMGTIAIGDNLLAQPAELVIESIGFELWANNKLFFATSRNTDEAFKIPAADVNGKEFRYEGVAVRVTGNVRISAITVAETMTGLREIQEQQ